MSQEPAPPSVIEKIISALGMNAAYVVDVHALYRHHPETVSPEWRGYFEGLERGEISPHQFPRAAPRSPGNGDGLASVPAEEIPVAPPEPPSSVTVTATDPDQVIPLTGPAALIANNMDASRSVPTATSYREIPVKALEENRRFLNHYLAQSGGRKISYTHLIAFAAMRALEAFPGINDAYAEIDGKPHRVKHAGLNLGVAVDLTRKDGSRNLLVPNIRDAQTMDFQAFTTAYDETIRAARGGKLGPDAFGGTTFSITNPGTVGTKASVPRLMPGQGAILAVGAIGHTAEVEAMSPDVRSRLGMSKQMTISLTYDHRVVQGAESGSYLATIAGLLMGEVDFYDRVFEDMGVPYHPVRWTHDVAPTGFGLRTDVDEITREARVLQLINAYRVRGHLIANLDPLGSEPQYHPELDIQYYGLTLWDLDRRFITGDRDSGRSAWSDSRATLREILTTLRATYCGTVGIEYMNIQDPEQKQWIQERMEPDASREPLPARQRKRILDKLIRSETFEQFLQTRFLGHKRFSLEGGETLIPMLDELLHAAAGEGVLEVVMGMAHRGRLNVLTQTIRVDPGRVFAEFEGNRDPHAIQGSGDVKYHLGATGRYPVDGGREIRISLSPNPSHLEAVDPVVEGIARAKQEQIGVEEGRRRILPLLVHGDAAFAGQGMVAETLNLSQLKGYRTGGTLHIIVNNQIGFTTPVESARSSPYPTDVAKMGQAPIFHVNADDPDAVIRVLRTALAFRQTFEKDVVIDLFCYRRHGHNEGDEPSYTQPRLYAKIRNHRSTPVLYAQKLVREGVLSREEADALRHAAQLELGSSFDGAREPMKPAPIEKPRPRPGGAPVPRRTRVRSETLQEITDRLTFLPAGIDLHPKLGRWMQSRREAIQSGEGIDWAFAEALAFGSLALEGVPVRLSGQDSVRGTFSQRHLLLRDDDTDTSWMGLQHLSAGQAPFTAVDSPLSEEAVLGFEFGYTLGDPSSLVLWEAQFGDFVNEAQVIIDQFLAGSFQKWGQPSALVLLLPHGYEGQGPEHSTARLERFLQLAAEDNLRVANVTTPAQYFHLLRRQMCEEDRRPLVVMTPKSLLRHPAAVSGIAELTEGSFVPVLDDPIRDARRVLLCSGKVFYDLVSARQAEERTDVAVVRLEELYPFPEPEIGKLLARHPQAKWIWVQEEPRNMGAWQHVRDRFERLGAGVVPSYVGRAESASTATGNHQTHLREQERLLGEALG